MFSPSAYIHGKKSVKIQTSHFKTLPEVKQGKVIF